MCDVGNRKTAPAILEKLAIYENNVLQEGAFGASRSVGLVSTLVSDRVAASPAVGNEAMVQGEGEDALIPPRRLPNPCLESPQRMDLHRELLFNQRIGKNVLNQKSELEKALSRHKEKQILNQVKEHKETPELERAIAERARRLEAAEHEQRPEHDGTHPALAEVRARLRHAAPPAHATLAHDAPSASAH